MENFNLYLELANSEVRAMESYNNFQMFLSDSIDYAMESMDSFKDSMRTMKEKVIRFFKMIFGAISRFFIKIFGAGERLGHKKAMTAIVTYAASTKLKIYKIVEYVIRYLMRATSTMETIILPESINESYESIKEDTEKIKEDVRKIVSTHTDKHEYSLIHKSDLAYIEKFTKDCQETLEKGLSALSGEHPTNSMQHKYTSSINTTFHKLLSSISEIESTIMQMMSYVMLRDTKLKHPITVEVED